MPPSRQGTLFPRLGLRAAAPANGQALTRKSTPEALETDVCVQAESRNGVHSVANPRLRLARSVAFSTHVAHLLTF